MTISTHTHRGEYFDPTTQERTHLETRYTKTDRLKRDENLRAIRKDGRKEWKKNSGYHVRSLAETTMFRLKTIFGEGLSALLFETQTTQALVRCAALNKMTHLGMPQSYKVT
jgi:hypothetical protein